jgi:hypothetical protein
MVHTYFSAIALGLAAIPYGIIMYTYNFSFSNGRFGSRMKAGSKSRSGSKIALQGGSGSGMKVSRYVPKNGTVQKVL